MRARFHPDRHRCLALAVLVGLGSTANAVDYTWAGGNLNWTAINWNPGPVTAPTAGTDNAIINTGRAEVTATITGSSAISIGAGGQLWLNANTLTVSNNTTLNGVTSGGAIFSGDRPAANVNVLSGQITLNATSNIASWWNDKTLSLTGKITGPGGLILDRATSLGDPVGGRFLISGTTNDYAGGTTVNGRAAGAIGSYAAQAVLVLGANNALPTGGTLTLNTANLMLNGYAQTLPGITGTGTGATGYRVIGGSATAGTLTMNVATSSSFAGILGGAGTNENNFSLVKTGAGTLTLPNANTYSGGTTLSGGTVAISNATSFGSGNVLVTGSSKITPVGGITYANAINVGAALTLQIPSATPGTATYTGQLTGSSSITVEATLVNAVTGTHAFTHSNNTFTGSVLMPIGTSGTGSGNDYFTFNSIGDGGTFTFRKRGHMNVIAYTGASAITFGTRQIALSADFGGVYDGGGTNPVNSFRNNAANSDHTVTFNTNLTPTTINAAGTFFFAGTNTGNNTFAGAISNPSNFNLGIGKTEVGKWILTGANSYLGETVVRQGTLSVNAIDVVANNQPLGKNAVVQLGQGSDSGILEFTGGTNSTTDKTVRIGSTTAGHTGAGTINNNGGGTLTFGSATFNPSAGAITVSRTLTLGGTNTGSNTISGIIQNNNGTTGAVALTKANAGTWVLSGASTYTGATTLSQGRLILRNTTTGFDSASTTIAAGAVLEFNTSISTNTQQLNAGGQTISGTGTLEKTGPGQLWFGGNGQTVNISLGSGALIDVKEGILRNEYFAGNWSANLADLNIAAGATVNVWDANIRVDGLSGSGTVDKSQGNTHTLTIGVDHAANAVFAGTIKNSLGTLALIKAGTGTQALTGNNTYTGTTSVTGGTLLVNGTHTGGGLTTASGSSTLGGTGSLGAVSILDATLAPGATVSPGAGTFNITAGLTLASTSTLAFDLGAPTSTADDFVAVTGNLALAGKLTVRPLAGFVPVIGNKWPLMSSSVTPTGGILPADIITVPSTPPPSGSRYEVQVIGNVVYLVVQDTENPEAICQNVTVTLDANGNGSTTAALVNNGSSDNSGAFTLSLSKTDFTCANIVPGGVPVILTVTDAAGNVDTCNATVTVVDTTPPVLSGVPADATVECSAVPPAATPTATDNCDTDVTIGYTEVRTNGTCPDRYTLTRTWTATDNFANTTTGVQILTVVDTTGPVITIADATVEYGSPTDPAATGTATALDNCSGTRDVSFSDVVVESDTACHLGTQVVMKITRTWSAEDACGNPTTKDQIITVMDTRTPRLSILTPAEVTIECSTSAMTPVAVVTPAPEGTTRIPATLDNPAPVPAVMSFVDVTEPGGDSCAYTVTRTWTVTDQGCNTVTFVQKIHVTDTSRPTVTAPPTATVPSGSPQDLDPMVTGQPTATDACDATPTLTYKDSPGVQVGDCPQNYDITRTWTAMDDCGNVHTGQQTIQVRAPMPVFDQHPLSQTTNLGGTATFMVEVSNTCGVRYQWLRNGLAISGATGPSYTVVSAHPLDNGAQYRCQVSRDFTSLLSDAATLTLTGPSQGSAALPPLLTIMPPPPGGADLVVSFPTEPGFLYHLQGRPSMDVDDWINLGDEFMGSGGIIEVDVPIESVPSGVFRLLVVPYLESPGSGP